MSGSVEFFILIPAMYALLALALTIIAVIDRRLIAARWAALGFFIAGVSIVVDAFKDPVGSAWVSWFTITTHFAPLLIMVQAFLSRHYRRISYAAVVIAALASIYIMPIMGFSPPNWFRGVFVQAVCTTIIVFGLPTLWAMRRKSVVDLIAFAVISLAALSYAGRTLVMIVRPMGETQADILAFYEGMNIIFHSASALMGMSVGIVLMMTIGHDMLRGRIEDSERDPLTRVGNRRQLDRLIENSEAGRRPIGAAIVIDLDHFKRINDSFGHDAGDEVLRNVGRKLKQMFRENGSVCRTGGEEFVVLVDDEYSDAVGTLALAVRALIAGLEFEGVIAQAKITASVGFHRIKGDTTVREGIQRADSAVYCAKTDGRNRVVAASSESGFSLLRAVA